jgi:hypothetical protein
MISEGARAVDPNSIQKYRYGLHDGRNERGSFGSPIVKRCASNLPERGVVLDQGVVDQLPQELADALFPAA